MEKLNHLAIIVDGNGRWAKKRGLNRSIGHREGAKNIEKLVLYMANNTDIKVVSLFVFSTENFKRPKEEVSYLMKLFKNWFKKSKKIYNENNIKVVFSGEKEPLSSDIYEMMEELASSTKDNTGLIVNFCLNYGGRREIVSSCCKIINDLKLNVITEKDINEELFNKYLYHDLGDIDLLIRTSGEERVSNFMLWQMSYAELMFVDTYFPDFDINCLLKAIDDYYDRDRRFGNVE